MLKSVLAFLALPGFAAGVVPTILIRSDPWRLEGSLFALLLAVVGLSILGRCVWDFHVFGRGTLAHWSPPKKLVNIGLYRRVRNPMYVGVISLILGLALTFGSPLALLWLVLLTTAFHLHIVLIEEPWLACEFPEEWAEYSARVSRWWPSFKRGGRP